MVKFNVFFPGKSIASFKFNQNTTSLTSVSVYFHLMLSDPLRPRQSSYFGRLPRGFRSKAASIRSFSSLLRIRSNRQKYSDEIGNWSMSTIFCNFLMHFLLQFLTCASNATSLIFHATPYFQMSSTVFPSRSSWSVFCKVHISGKVLQSLRNFQFFWITC